MSNSFNSLAQNEKSKFWQDIEAKINSALELCADHISTDALEETHEYLEHNELGLAGDETIGRAGKAW
jgi:hypothetical protein